MLDNRGAEGDATDAGEVLDGRSNSEKLDDAGLLTDVAYAEHQPVLDALPPEVVEEMIVAFNAQQVWRPSEDRQPGRTSDQGEETTRRLERRMEP